MDLGAYLDAARAFDQAFRNRWEPVTAAPRVRGRPRAAGRRLGEEFTGRLGTDYPFFHPATPARCSSRRTRWRSRAT